jgi:thiosulfate reductase cytochrome b subunit
MVYFPIMSNSFCSFSRSLYGRVRVYVAVASVAYLLSLAVVLGLVVLGGLLCGSRDDTFTRLELLGLLGGHFGEFWRR